MVSRSGRGVPVAPDEQRAIDILGIKRVLVAGKVANFWDTGLEEHPVVPFSEKTLRKCAAENKDGAAAWRLIFVVGFSLEEQRKRRGIDYRSHQPCFRNSNWWFGKAWENEKGEPGYRLLDFQLRYPNTKWQDQEDVIAMFGEWYERASERDVAEAVFSVFMATEERLLERGYHWGSFLTERGQRIQVGSFIDSGLSVSTGWPARLYPDTSVIVARKPDL